MYCVLRNELVFEKDRIWLHPVAIWLEWLMLVVLSRGKEIFPPYRVYADIFGCHNWEVGIRQGATGM